MAANADDVWDVLAAIDRWPDWNPDIKAASLQGTLSVGSRFSLESGTYNYQFHNLAIAETSNHGLIRLHGWNQSNPCLEAGLDW